MDEDQETVSEPSAPTPPIDLTRERLSEVGQAWKSYAEQQIELYKGKLPGFVLRYLDKPEPAPAEPAETGAA